MHAVRFHFSFVLSTFAAIGFCLVTGPASGHDGAGDHDHEHGDHAANVTDNGFLRGDAAYRWIHRDDLGKQNDELVEAARRHLHNSADEDVTTGEVVTVVGNYGLITLDKDLGQWSLVPDQDPVFAAGMNSHGADCFVRDGQSFWVFASTNTNTVVVSQRGKVIAKLEKPTGDEFDNDYANSYYAGGGGFTPCDVTYIASTDSLMVVTGYSAGDFAVTAKYSDGQWKWSGVAFGGKTSMGGPFATAHGIDVPKTSGATVVEIASRSHGKLYAFTPEGAQVKLTGSEDGNYVIDLPQGSRPCDVCTVDSLRFVPLLDALPGTNNAPVLVLNGSRTAGQLVPADYEGLQYMRHMHGLRMVQRDGKLFAITLAWPNGGENKAGNRNDGRLAIFEAVPAE